MRLNDAAEAILAAAVASFDTYQDVPTRQYVTFGEIVDDCEQVVVAWQGLTAGLSGAAEGLPAKNCVRTRAGTFEVRVIRCVPSIDSDGPPTPAELDAMAEIVLDDAWALWTGLNAANADGSLHVTEPGFRAVIGPALPVTPSGKVGGTSISVTVDL